MGLGKLCPKEFGVCGGVLVFILYDILFGRQAGGEGLREEQGKKKEKGLTTKHVPSSLD